MADRNRSKEAWGTRLGVILAVMGSAVGLGNFLRFPGKAAQYEGGAFMVPYFIALLVLGIPLAWAEWSMGRYGGTRGFNSAPGIYRSIWKNRAAPYMGVLGLVVPVVIYMYYVFIEAWCLAYAWYMLTGDLNLGTEAASYGAFFATFTGLGENGFLLNEGGVAPAMVFLLICFALNFALIYRGISRGIEKFCLVAMPLLVVCALLVLARVLTLGTPNPERPELNVVNGLGYLWNAHTPERTFFQSLLNGQMWLEATGQVFFTLSVGFGVIITYASYLRKQDDVALSSLTSCAGNEFCEVALGGMITVTAAFVFLGTAGIAGQGTFGLGFVSLPMVFQMMPLGQVVGFLFFFLLFLAAITSSLSMLQPAIALFEEGLGLDRKASVTLIGFITLVGALLVVYFSKDLIGLDTMDFWVGTMGILVLAFFQVILFGWIMGIDRGMEEVNRGGAIRVPRLVGLLLKYVAPPYLAVVFIAFFYQAATAEGGNYVQTLLTNRSAQLTVGFMAIVGLLFTALVAQAVRRWRRIEQQQEAGL